MKSFLIFCLASLGAFAVQASSDTELTPSATTIVCLPTPVTAVFSMPGFHIWDPSVIRVGETYHLFASRWASDDTKDRNFSGWKSSHIIRATSDNLFGPYTFAEIVFGARPDQWDNVGNHNPKIMRVGDRFLLYYLGITNKTAWATAFAWADDIEGPWTRGDAPSIPTNNPALWVHADGSAYAVGKRRSPLVPDVRPWTNWMEAFTAPQVSGPYAVLGDPMTNRLPADYELEDPTIWWDGAHYHVIVTDWKAKATGEERAGVHYRSADGVVYELVSPRPVYDHKQLAMESPAPSLTLRRRERPQIVLDENNAPIALWTSFLENGGESGVAVTPIEMRAVTGDAP